MFKTFRQILTRHYFDLRGRVGRAAFWNFFLASAVVYGGTLLAAFALSQAAHRLTPAMNCVEALVALALLPPLAGMGIRRMRDAGENGLVVWVLIVSLAVRVIARLLGGEPFLILKFNYFYLDELWLLNLVSLISLVALTSFWMQPDSREPAVVAAAGTS